MPSPSPPPSPSPSSIGFCGKLPDRGDFVRRRLPHAVACRWEEWLDAGLTASRAASDSTSPALLMNAPVWRFAASLPCVGGGGLAGVMMPSFDRVGRHYPLSVIAILDNPAAAIAAALWSQHWFYDIERVALAALLGHLDFAEFDARLASSSGPGGPGLPPFGVPSRRSLSRPGPLAALSALIGRLAGPSPEAFSLWWRDAPADGREFCLMFPGLPGPDDFPRLLTPAPDPPLAFPPGRSEPEAGSGAAGM